MARFVAALALIGTSGLANALTLHVSPTGDDTWSGLSATPATDRTDGPLQTLTGARDRLRSLRTSARLVPGEIRVVVHAGEYALGETLAFTSEDGGSRESPVTWTAQPGDEVVVTGGRRIPAWAPVTDAALLEPLSEAARGKVVQADLRALGIDNFGSADGSGLMLYYNGAPMTTARWPNEGFTRIVEEAGGDKYDIRGTTGDRIGKWVYDGDRPSQWTGQNDVWVHGYCFGTGPTSVTESRPSTVPRAQSKSRSPITTTATAKASGTTSTTCSTRSTRRGSGTSTATLGCCTSGRRTKDRVMPL